MFTETSLQETDIETKEEYLTSPQHRMGLIHPTIYMAIQSRGTGKSTVLQAMRSLRIGNFDVPRSVNVNYGANYAGLQLRTMPGTLAGWMRFGFKEGDDFVINTAPPKSWPRPYGYESPLSYKNTISTRYGSIFILGSNDRPGMVNSLSITGHVGVDEFRFINFERMAQDLFPAMRGNLSHWGGNNPHNLSMTFTSDRPFAGESEWYLDYAKLMNLDQIYKIKEVSELHESKLSEIIGLKHELDRVDIDLKQRQELREALVAKDKELKRIAKALRTVRSIWFDKHKGEKGEWIKGSCFYDEASVFSNIHVLTLDYVKRNSDPRIMPKETFMTSFLNLKPIKVEHMFYGAWNPKVHVINGSWDYEELDRIGILNPEKEQVSLRAAFLHDYNPDAEVDIEFDFGDLVTCSVSQTVDTAEGTTELYLATFELKYPYTVEHVIDEANSFLSDHRNRVMNLYLDPSGHYQKDKEKSLVYAAKAKKRLDRHHWRVVERVPEGALNALHDIKHTTINDILRENDYLLPKVRMVRETNKALINSIQMTPYRIVYNDKGQKLFAKDKSSEKELALKDKREGNTSDHSDHFDIKLMHKYGHKVATPSGFNPDFM